MKITYYGHACVGVTTANAQLLFDPFITPNPLASHIDVDAIAADYILLSHGHGDHLADALTIAQRTQAQIMSNYEIVSWYENKHQYKNIHPMNHGGSWLFPFGKLRYVNAVHSSVLPDGTYGGNPGGFVVEHSEGNFYFAGDTALTFDMQLIPRFTRLDFAFLPIGSNFTMGVEEAVVAAEFIQCKTIVGIHYDTFGYIKIDHVAAKAAFAAVGRELVLLEIGETWEP